MKTDCFVELYLLLYYMEDINLTQLLPTLVETQHVSNHCSVLLEPFYLQEWLLLFSARNVILLLP